MILHRGKHWGQPLSSGYHCNTPILGHSVIITLKGKQMDRHTKEANEVEGISSQRSAGEIKKPGIFCFSPRAGSSVAYIPGPRDSATCSRWLASQGPATLLIVAVRLISKGPGTLLNVHPISKQGCVQMLQIPAALVSRAVSGVRVLGFFAKSLSLCC